MGQNFLTRVGSIFFGSGWVGSAINGLGLNLENFPEKCQIFQFFSLRVRSKAGRPLIYCGSKVSSGPITKFIGKPSFSFFTHIMVLLFIFICFNARHFWTKDFGILRFGIFSPFCKKFLVGSVLGHNSP